MTTTNRRVTSAWRYLCTPGLGLGLALVLALGPQTAFSDDDESRQSRYQSGSALVQAAAALSIDSARWDSERRRLTVYGSGQRGEQVKVVNAYDADQDLGDDDVNRQGNWRVSRQGPSPVPCRVRAMQSDGQTAEADVANAPSNCAPKGGNDNQPPTVDANGPYSGIFGESISFDSNGSTDSDGEITSFLWDFGDGSTSSEDNPSYTYSAPGTYTVTLTVTDNDGASDSDTTSATIESAQQNQPPTAAANGPYSAVPGDAISFSSAGSGDPDGSIVSYSWNFGDGQSSTAANPSHAYAAVGSYTVTLTVTDNQGASASAGSTATISEIQGACTPADLAVSINSTAQNGCPDAPLAQQPSVLNGNYSVLAINDLGMHCGDLDTRVSSILPPFQVLLAQVIRKGEEPEINPAGIDVVYSAASNPNDPILGSNVFDGVLADGNTYKTNFWDGVARGTYDPFYPGGLGITPLVSGAFPVTPDVGLPVPNVEDLYIGPDGQVNSGDEFLAAVQHAMPGIAAPYAANDPQLAEEHYEDKPFFVNFPFGYVAEDVNWYEGAGIPFAAYDDNGRENAYPLVRVQARDANGTVVSTVDTVLPISGEASCTNCHSTNVDYTSVHGEANRTDLPTTALSAAGLPVATSLDDPDDNLPLKVSLEYAADINVLRLHDLKHGQAYVTPSAANDGTTVSAPCDITANAGMGDGNCLTNKALLQDQPVVCQVCHYTPALDLAQVGPMTGPVGSTANGRNQLSHESNSRVMHNHHGNIDALDRNGQPMFPDIAQAQQGANGSISNQGERLGQLEDSCYQCHPGRNVQCLRGAMFNGGMLCSDCHGSMQQVGNDFSAGVSPDNPGAFILGQGNFYDMASLQPRTPWANEPGCGSCHTGDASNNLAGDAGTLVNTVDTNGNPDGIRLRQAFLTGDAKATPIVPGNKRFAEPVVPEQFNGFANPGAGNPQLYRVSTGHGGVMCEGCHGATHAEWPNANPASNDNVTALQLQGHTGTLVECAACHGTAMNGRNTLDGPHGMHPVGEDTDFARGGHESLAEDNPAACAVCHGPGGRSTNQGTVLSLAKADRNLRGTSVRRGDPVGCAVCHSNMED